MARVVQNPAARSAERLAGDGFDVGLTSCAFDAADREPDAVLARYGTLSGWAEALIEAGCRGVTVVQRFHRDAFIRRRGVDYHFVGGGGSAESPRWWWGARVGPLVRRLAPAVVHLDGLVYPEMARWLRLWLPRDTPIVVQDHGGLHPGSLGFRQLRWRTVHRLGLRAADGFLFTARDQAVPWIRAGIVGARQSVYEVPEASTDLHSLPTRDELARTLPGRPALLWVGRLNSNKDPLTVLDGFELAAKVLPNAALTFVFGEDDLIVPLRARIRDSAVLRTRVHLLGRLDRSALPALYRNADLFVLASHHEGSGFALIEALSFGAVPIVTDIPSFRALTDGGKLGGLFPVGDPVALARSIESVGPDAAQRRPAVLAHFERELSWSAVGRKALTAYRDAASARKREAPGRGDAHGSRPFSAWRERQ